MAEVIQLEHPVVKHHLSRLREADARPPEFRDLVERLTFLVTHRATEDLPTEPVTIRTPLADAAGCRIQQRIGVVPILRAGMGMVDPVLRLLPDAEVWHLGIYRDEQTLKPVEYYQKLPEGDPVDLALVVDPMLATGGSAVAALRLVQRWGAKQVKLLTIIAAPEGIGVVHEAHPEVPIYTCAVDDHLNEHGYIVPGLGDAGDRIFNTGA